MDGKLRIGAGQDDDELVVSGVLDIGTSALLEAAIAELRNDGHESVSLHLSGVTFIDSRGLRSLLVAAAAGPLTLRSPSFAIRRLLTLTNTDGEFTIVG